MHNAVNFSLEQSPNLWLHLRTSGAKTSRMSRMPCIMYSRYWRERAIISLIDICRPPESKCWIICLHDAFIAMRSHRKTLILVRDCGRTSRITEIKQSFNPILPLGQMSQILFVDVKLVENSYHESYCLASSWTTCLGPSASGF